MLTASCRRISVRIASAVWSAEMYGLMSSAMMCAFFLPRRWFCVISAPGDHEHVVLAPGALRFALHVLEIRLEVRPRAMPNVRRPSVATRPARASQSCFIRM